VPKTIPSVIPVAGNRTSKEDEEDVETFTIVVINTLYEQRGLENKDFLIIRDSTQFENGEDILYCVRKSGFYNLTGKHYVHKPIFTKPDASPLPGPTPIASIEYRTLNSPLKNVRMFGKKNEVTLSSKEDFGILQGKDLPAGLSVPKGSSAFFLVADPANPKSIYFHNSEELIKASREVGSAEQVDSSKHSELSNAANSYLGHIKKKVLNPQLDFKKENIQIGLSKNKRNGNYLVQFPVKKEDNSAPCGSYHYLPHSPKGADAFASPTTSCLFSAALQDWKKNHCPDSELGCRVAWGDMSHVSIQERSGSTWPHSEHNLGLCIDVRPLKKGSFEDKGLVWGTGKRVYTRRKKKRILSEIKNRDYNEEYDQEKTKDLIEVFKNWGASKVLFNDNKECGSQLCSGHDNHVHVCFEESAANKTKCLEEVKIEKDYCPELASDINDPQSQWVYKWSPQK
jgi:hypothetical protein